MPDTPVTHQLDQDLAVRPLGEGRYAGALTDRWSVGGGVNGGFELALLGNAIRAHLPTKPDPLAVSAHFLSAGTDGPAEVSVEVRREGGRTATVAADLVQDGRTRLTALATYADLGSFGEGPTRSFGTEPELPPVEECLSTNDVSEDVLAFVPMLRSCEMRMAADMTGWLEGRSSGRGRFAAYYRLRDGREPDTLSLLQVVDALPPVTFDLDLPGWAPTVELTAYVRAKPAPGWLKVQHLTRHLEGGMFEEDCEVWDSTGRLVAQSRQLALTPK